MHNTPEENLKSFLVLIALGLVYQDKFVNRNDWFDLAKVFFPISLTKYFIENGRSENGLFKISHREIPQDIKQKSLFNLVDCFGAVETRRIERTVGDNDISFKIEGHEVQMFYLYPFEIDYGPYAGLPPCLAVFLHPFIDFFTLGYKNFSQNNNVIILETGVFHFNEKLLNFSEIRFCYKESFKKITDIELILENKSKINVSFINETIDFCIENRVTSFTFVNIIQSIDKFSEFLESNL